MALEGPQIRQLFSRLDRWAPSRFPSRAALSDFIGELITTGTTVVNERDVVLFATASVEMWQRALYTLILAVAVKDWSTPWACVAGYYASHYCMRAFAHLFGYFAIYYQRHACIEVSPYGGAYQCGRVSLSGNATREHRFYWVTVKRRPEFANDPLFTLNADRIPVSDSSHRGFASYADHLYDFKSYKVADRLELRTQFSNLATTALQGANAITIPARTHYPNLATVLSVAYLRVYRFREYLDELLPDRVGRFWLANRMPSWCQDLGAFPPRLPLSV